MNERIRELYIQTSNETAHGKEWAIGGLHNAKRFAELIVLECARIIEAQDCDPSFKNRMSWAMKDKFGV